MEKENFIKESIKSLYSLISTSCFQIFTSTSIPKKFLNYIRIEKTQYKISFEWCYKNECIMRIYVINDSEPILRISLLWPKDYALPKTYSMFAESPDFYYVDKSIRIEKYNFNEICKKIKEELEKLIL
ncbi:MAG: hypothetical protein QW409_03385 [Candidatus Aenigmatarchaeota archaeon]